jgi:hypothetical protein
MRHARFLAIGFAFSVAAMPAFAQMSMGGGGSAPQPKLRAPEIAPPALPGAGYQAPLATGPKLQKVTSGDPTQALFAAVNKGDYNAAQDAISRGADLTAQNQFGETPLDLAIALNRNTITFLLLETRNELGAQDSSGPVGQTWGLNSPSAPLKPGKHHGHVEPQRGTPVAAPLRVSPRVNHAAGAGVGTPNPEAGFLGFGPKN